METPERYDDRRSDERRQIDRRVPRSITPSRGTPVAADDRLGFPLRAQELEVRVRDALLEDGAFADLTTIACVRSDRRAHASVVALESGTISGIPLAVCAFRLLDPNVAIRIDVDDGGVVSEGTVVMRITGLARAILSAERVALNFLQRLSGISSLTARYVDAVRGTRTAIVDTRKTTPGFRTLEKYAVRAGGARNHRVDLTETAVIKDNHLAAAGRDIAFAVRRVREFSDDGTRVEVECEALGEVRAAIDAGADILLLKRMSADQLRECMALVNGRAAVEVAGSISLDRARSLALAGADRISVAALTQRAEALNLVLNFDPT